MKGARRAHGFERTSNHKASFLILETRGAGIGPNIRVRKPSLDPKGAGKVMATLAQPAPPAWRVQGQVIRKARRAAWTGCSLTSMEPRNAGSAHCRGAHLA